MMVAVKWVPLLGDERYFLTAYRKSTVFPIKSQHKKHCANVGPTLLYFLGQYCVFKNLVIYEERFGSFMSTILGCNWLRVFWLDALFFLFPLSLAFVTDIVEVLLAWGALFGDFPFPDGGTLALAVLVSVSRTSLGTVSAGTYLIAQ